MMRTTRPWIATRLVVAILVLPWGVGDNYAFTVAYPETEFFKIGNKRGSINMSFLRTTNM